jgi:hypothetical protein
MLLSLFLVTVITQRTKLKTMRGEMKIKTNGRAGIEPWKHKHACKYCKWEREKEVPGRTLALSSWLALSLFLVGKL